MQVRSLGQEGPLEEGMATHSSILAWRIPWTEEPSRLQSMGSQSRTQLKQFSTQVHMHWTSLVAQTVKHLPTMRETWVQSLGWEDPLEEGMATHSSILAWRIPIDSGTWLATAHGVAQSQTQLSSFTFTSLLHHQTHPRLSIISTLAQMLHSFWSC